LLLKYWKMDFMNWCIAYSVSLIGHAYTFIHLPNLGKKLIKKVTKTSKLEEHAHFETIFMRFPCATVLCLQ